MFTRRRFLETCLAGSALAGSGQLVAGAETRQETFSYKTVDGHAIHADLHRAADDVVRPVVVWIHGGALINGHREGISSRVKTWAAESGYALVSIDYRLAPETKLPAIISDLEDAFVWIREEGPSLLRIDPERLVVAGGSAGGCLTLTAGFRVEPPPKALLALWGYGDLIGPWYSEPSPHPRHHRSKLSHDEAWQQVSGPVVSDSRERKGNGGAFYQYCRQTGEWPEAVTGWDPHTQAEKFHPFMAVKNVTSKYPPTVMIHGTADTDVPYEQSVMMADEFRKHGVPHELLTIENGEHGLGGGDARAIDAAYQRGFHFLDRYLAADADR